MRHEQFSRNDIVKAWQTITIPPDFFNCLTSIKKTNSDSYSSGKSLGSEGSSFVMAEKEIESDSDDSIISIQADKNELQTIQPSDEVIIELSHKINITYPSLSNEFLSGYFIIQQQHDESDIQFAMRRLSAITPPLLHTDLNISEENMRFIQEINHWHEIHCTIQKNDSIDRALAETAFYFNAEYYRLIIRHTPAETENSEKEKKAQERQKIIRKQIVTYLKTHQLCQSDELSNVHHITPIMINGLQSSHIILAIENEATERTVQIDSKQGVSLFTNTYYYLNMQSLLNGTDCGRYITVAAVLAAKILSEQSEKTLENLTLTDFTECEILKKSAKCKDARDLRMLLGNLQLSPSNNTHQPSSLLERFSCFANSFVQQKMCKTSNKQSSSMGCNL